MNELNGDYLDTTLTANKNNWYNSYWDSSTNKPVFRQTGVFDYTKVIKSNTGCDTDYFMVIPVVIQAEAGIT